MLLAERMRNKEKLIGMYVEMTDIAVAKIAGLAGYDYVWVDTEHACMSYETLLGHIIALQATGTPVVVRASQDDLAATKKILEMGGDGIIFPMVKTPEEADRLIASTLCPPHGNRGFGPRDLSGSYGVLGDVYGEKITGVIRSTMEKLHENGKYAMVAAAGCTSEIIQHWHDLGADMITAGADSDFIRDAAVKNCENMKKIHKGLQNSSPSVRGHRAVRCPLSVLSKKSRETPLFLAKKTRQLVEKYA